MMLKKLIFLFFTASAAFSGKLRETKLTESEDVQGIHLRHYDVTQEKTTRIEAMRNDLFDQEQRLSIEHFLKNSGVRIPDAFQSRPLETVLSTLIENTDKSSWGLIFPEKIFSYEESIAYFKEKLFPEDVENFSRHVVELKFPPLSYYDSLGSNILYFLKEPAPVLYITVNNSEDAKVLSLFKNLNLESAQEEKSEQLLHKRKMIKKEERSKK